MTEPEVLTVDEARQRLRIGRTALYALLRSGRLRSFSVGRRRLIPAAAISEFVASALHVTEGGHGSQ